MASTRKGYNTTPEDDKYREVVYDFTATRCIDQPIHCTTKSFPAKKSCVLCCKKEVQHQPYLLNTALKKVNTVGTSKAEPSWSLYHQQCKPVEAADVAKFFYYKNDNCL